MLYAGLDIHKSFCQAVVLTETGEVVKCGKTETDREALISFFSEFREPIEIAIESTGVWEPVYEWLEEGGYKVRLSHPLKTKAIAYAKVKTDKIDARTLADLLRANLLPQSYVPPKEIRALRNLCRERISIVRERTKWMSRIRAELGNRGIKPELKDIFTKKGREWLHSLQIPKIERMLEIIKTEEEKIKEIDNEIKRIAETNENIQILTTIPGIGTYSATLIYAEIGEIDRFPSSEKLCGYAGLVPSTYQSGHTIYHGRLTKEGSAYLRWILIECTQIHVMNANSHLTRYWNRLCKRIGKQKAIVATARKMLKVIYWMLKNKEPFIPFPERLGNNFGVLSARKSP